MSQPTQEYQPRILLLLRFCLFVARFLTVAQLRNLCQASKDFSGTFLLCVLSCRDLVDGQLQHAFVARLVKASK